MRISSELALSILLIYALVLASCGWEAAAAQSFRSNSVIVAAAGKSKNAAIPRAKSSKAGAIRLPGGDVFQKLFREAKIGFCSELEALTLQVSFFNCFCNNCCVKFGTFSS